MRLQKHTYHFIGVGGIGMCGLAEVLCRLGAKVSGSDLHPNSNTERLKQLGVKVFIGHQESNVEKCDVVVYSSAVSTDNPEMLAAKKNHIPVIRRAEALAEIMRFKRGIALAGTHGKTTTTSMVSSIFLEAKQDPTIVVGGRFSLIESTAFLGQGEWVIAESDESDGSFESLTPEFSVVTNIDTDHMDYYKSLANLESAFQRFISKIPFYGAAIICGDDPSLKKISQNFEKRILTYGFDTNNDYVLAGENGTYRVKSTDGKSFEFSLKFPGRHNALNALAAIIVSYEAGIDLATAIKGIEKFSGVDRRFQLKGEAKGISIYDDYGHHPTEIKATLQGFAEKFPNRFLRVVFQPHRYSRTHLCWPEFLNCFALANEVVITDIYAAGEQPIAGVTSQKLASEIRGPHCEYIQKENLKHHLLHKMQSGDVLITLGAGDITRLGPELLEELNK